MRATSPSPRCGPCTTGDRARKTTLVDYGFRLPCAYDNRPLKFEEFEQRLNQVVYVSANPGGVRAHPLRPDRGAGHPEPTACWTPRWRSRPVEGQIDDLIGEINLRTQRSERVLITNPHQEDRRRNLTAYLQNTGIKVRYLHHDIDTIERMEIMRDLRLGTFDVLVGINLLREGLDLPKFLWWAILDADKEGFLRSETSLIQTIGRRPEMPTAWSSCTPTPSPPPCAGPWTRRSGAGEAGRLQQGPRHRPPRRWSSRCGSCWRSSATAEDVASEERRAGSRP